MNRWVDTLRRPKRALIVDVSIELDNGTFASTRATACGTTCRAAPERVDDESFWDVDCDILIPAALEGQITAARADGLKARLVLEGANGPTVPSADDILASRGVTVVPDVICNAGGVTVSYFEWVQDFSSFFWSEEEINHRLDKIMVEALDHICHTAERHGISLRTATYAVACERILMARQ